MIAMNTENSNAKVFYLMLVRRVGRSFVGVATNHVEVINAYSERHFKLEAEQERMRDMFNGKTVFIRKLRDGVPQEKTINNTVTMEVQKQRNVILELQLKFMLVNFIESRTKKSWNIAKRSGT